LTFYEAINYKPGIVAAQWISFMGFRESKTVRLDEKGDAILEKVSYCKAVIGTPH